MAKARQSAAAAKSAPVLPLWQKALLGLLSLPLAALVLPSLMILVIGMVPTFVAFIADRTRERYLTITVGLPNACGCLPALVSLWAMGQSFSNAQIVLTDPFGWAVAFGAAGLGWLVYLSAPPVAAVYYASSARMREQTLKRLQKSLIETWGEEVAGEHGPPPAEAEAQPTERA